MPSTDHRGWREELSWRKIKFHLGRRGKREFEGTDKILREFMTRGAAVGQEQ